jgi:hypothetical protein
MTSYATEIRSTLPPAQAFAYMADFANARFWDPSVSSAQRQGEGAIGLGTSFDVTTRFAKRGLELTYAIVEFEPPTRVVLEARRKFVSRDTITVVADGTGSLVRYEAVLAFGPVGRLFHPVMQRVFDRIGEKARTGLAAALNPPV